MLHAEIAKGAKRVHAEVARDAKMVYDKSNYEVIG
jgi:hypothetical protein